MRCAGGGAAELETFCGVMNLPHPVRKKTSQQNRDKVKFRIYPCEMQQKLSTRWLNKEIRMLLCSVIVKKIYILRSNFCAKNDLSRYLSGFISDIF